MSLTFPFTLVPPELLDYAYVAGGWATDPEQTRDIDMWIIGSGTVHTHDEFDVRALFAHHTPELTFAKSENAYTLEAGFVQIGNLYWPSRLPDSKVIQLFTGPCETVTDLINMFDLSVHQRAIDSNGITYRAPTTTDPGVAPIEVTRWTTPLTTLMRYFRLSDRYQSGLNWDLIKKLCIKVAEEEAKKFGVDTEGMPF